jgi:hypothetical protein
LIQRVAVPHLVVPPLGEEPEAVVLAHEHAADEVGADGVAQAVEAFIQRLLVVDCPDESELGRFAPGPQNVERESVAGGVVRRHRNCVSARTRNREPPSRGMALLRRKQSKERGRRRPRSAPLARAPAASEPFQPPHVEYAMRASP